MLRVFYEVVLALLVLGICAAALASFAHGYGDLAALLVLFLVVLLVTSYVALSVRGRRG